MSSSVKEKVLEAILNLNKMVDEYDSSSKLQFCRLIEIRSYHNDCKVILNRALAMSKKELFSDDELKFIKRQITTVEIKINSFSTNSNCYGNRALKLKIH